MPTSPRRTRAAALFLIILSLVVAACGDTTSRAAAPAGGAAPADPDRTLKISAIPDQDPAKLVTINQAMATHLAAKLGVKVEFVPVTDYLSLIHI